MAMHASPRRTHGFTLVEIVIVITLLGIVGAMVAVFMKKPIDAYFDTARRAALVDLADTTTRRMAREIRSALPNSLRVASNQCVEFIPTKVGGRYRAETSSTGTGDTLDFSTADSSFDVYGDLGALPTAQRPAVGDLVAVYNLGITDSDAYNLDNVSAITSVTNASPQSSIGISPKKFPLASGSSRFQVIPSTDKVVSYACSGGKLYRFSNYAYSATSSCQTPVSSTPVLATDVASCNFVYNGSDLQRNALVQISLVFTRTAESVSLYHEVHVNNTP
jgi:MSHA biogenesis protein MshO